MFKDRLPQYQELEELRDSKLLVYFTGDRRGMETQIHSEVLEHFVEHLDNIGKVKKISLLLYTRGGNTLAAWSLVNLIRQFCEEFEVIIPSKAHSSGTLISLGANTIVMTKQATLGPIDPSLTTPLNPQNPTNPNNPQARLPVSVESLRGYLELAQEDLKIHNERELSEILIRLSDKVHPLVIGDIYRSRTQIKMLAKKLLSKQLDNQDQIEKIISFLSSDSGSHDYTIYRNEARDELGLNIEKPDDHLYELIKSLYDDIKLELELAIPFDPKVILANKKSNYDARRVIIESIGLGTHVHKSMGNVSQQIQQIQTAPNKPPIQRVVISDDRTFEGWIFEKA